MALLFKQKITKKSQTIFRNKKISNLIKEAKDTAGAGDALLVSSSLALARKLTYRKPAYLV